MSASTTAVTARGPAPPRGGAAPQTRIDLVTVRLERGASPFAVREGAGRGGR
jgi:hypothetical protein